MNAWLRNWIQTQLQNFSNRVSAFFAKKTDVPLKTSQLQNDSKFITAESPTFTGTPKAPTPSTNANNTQIATTAFVKTLIFSLVNGAPETLDTLKELADAIEENGDVVEALNSTITGKLDNKGYYNGFKTSINDIQTPGISTMYVNHDENEEYLGVHGDILIITTGKCDGYQYQIIFAIGSLKLLCRSNRTYYKFVFTYDDPLYQIGLDADIVNNYYGLKYSQKLFTNGDDLNDYLTPGQYRSRDAAMTATLLNCPYTGSGFELTVDEINGGQYIQTIKAFKHPFVYVRTYEKNVTTWSKWNNIFNQFNDFTNLLNAG